MSIEINGATIIGGTVGAVFDNNRGSIQIKNLQVRDIITAALIATANGGVSLLENGKIESSDIDSITFTTAGAKQTIINTIVTNMNFIQDAFYVEDISSSLIINNINIEQNIAITTPWSAIVARSKSILSIINSTISDNTFIEFGIIGFDSSITITDSRIDRNVGVVSIQNYFFRIIVEIEINIRGI